MISKEYRIFKIVFIKSITNWFRTALNNKRKINRKAKTIQQPIPFLSTIKQFKIDCMHGITN